MSVYFVTGATGTVGSTVVARLLADSQARVLALVRASSPAHAASRLEDALATMGKRGGFSIDRGRIRAVAGNVESRRLGLSAADHSEVSASCTHIIHCAGAVRMNLPLAEARLAAVDAMGNVLELAQILSSAGQLRKMEVVSTVGVGGREHPFLREDWIGASHRFHNTYEQAKAEAEQLAHTAVRNGLPVVVHRPSMVVGDSHTGHTLQFQIFYFLVEFLAGRRTGGLFPELGAARLDIVPVDFVAEAIVRSSQTDATTGRILHLCAGPQGAVLLRRLQAIIRERLVARGERIVKARYISRPLFRKAARGLRMLSDKSTRAALGTLPILLDYLDTEQVFDNGRTAEWLMQEGVPIPSAEHYLPHVLDFYFAAKRTHARGKHSIAQVIE